jgi:hypothetical protein
MAKGTRGSDDDNTGFAIRENAVKHKPGFDLGKQAKEGEAAGNHRFKRSDPKDVPQRSLAERIVKGG